MLNRLDQAIGPHHTIADDGWFRLLLEGSRDDYINQLVQTYGFEAPYEAASAHTPGLAQVIDLRDRWRAGLIAQDLLSLGWSQHEIAAVRSSPITPFQDAAEALGWTYVVERPTLMYREVRAELVARFIDLARATTYLGAFAKVVNRRWAELGIALDHVGQSERAAERILDAAHAALEAKRDWVSVPMLHGAG
jgi:heme oxygenase